MSEQQPDTQPPVPAAEEERKAITFAVRIDPGFREQIEGLRGITGQSVNDVGIEALNDWVAKKLSDPEIGKKAMADIDAEEQRLRERKAAIAGILGKKASDGAAPASGEATPEASTTSRGGRRKTT